MVTFALCWECSESVVRLLVRNWRFFCCCFVFNVCVCVAFKTWRKAGYTAKYIVGAKTAMPRSGQIFCGLIISFSVLSFIDNFRYATCDPITAALCILHWPAIKILIPLLLSPGTIRSIPWIYLCTHLFTLSLICCLTPPPPHPPTHTYTHWCQTYSKLLRSWLIKTFKFCMVIAYIESYVFSLDFKVRKMSERQAAKQLKYLCNKESDKTKKHTKWPLVCSPFVSLVSFRERQRERERVCMCVSTTTAHAYCTYVWM